MSEAPNPSEQPPVAPPTGFPPAPPAYGQPPTAYAGEYAPVQMGGYSGVGQIRGTGMSIFLFIITLGIYGWFWYYNVHDEMKRHKNGDGLGGGLALVLAIFAGIVMPYITSDEVGKLYEMRGQPKPVSAMTGLWSFPGIFLLGIGPIVWFVKTNGALNDYWRSLGATG
ncbi:MAG: DUF4234 domain-containing protein [Frankiaceae bacterium]|nr:DUF4234 domain-containing protein [Frankiaceae bacterium]MBV9872916.1 DUF4234 domain-containing protein [Frankiaceae bacterium]